MNPWIKGALIGGGVGLGSYLLSIGCGYLFGGGEGAGLACFIFLGMPIMVPMALQQLVFTLPSGLSTNLEAVLSISLAVIVWMIFGSLIFKLISVIRSRKQGKESIETRD